MQAWLKEWVVENEVKILDWLAYSPDLNPIENAWQVLKSEIIKQYPELAEMPKNNTLIEAFIKAAIIMWDKIKEEVLDKLLLLIVWRLEAVIKADS